MDNAEKALIEKVIDDVTVLQQAVNFINDSVATIQHQLEGLGQILGELHPHYYSQENVLICHLPYRPIR